MNINKNSKLFWNICRSYFSNTLFLWATRVSIWATMKFLHRYSGYIVEETGEICHGVSKHIEL